MKRSKRCQTTDLYCPTDLAELEAMKPGIADGTTDSLGPTDLAELEAMKP